MPSFDRNAPRLALAMAFLAITGCASVSAGSRPADEASSVPGAGDAPETRPASLLGRKPATAIEVCDADGEHAYLQCLACPDGSPPSFRRLGSFGSREKALAGEVPADPTASSGGSVGHAGHIVDGYRVVCGDKAQMLFFDMYHCDPASCREPPGPFSTCATEAPKNPGPPDGFVAFPECLELLYSSAR
jgi:hypothetical protein